MRTYAWLGGIFRLLVLGVLLTNAAAVAGSAGATVPGENGRLVFEWQRADIYSVNPDGTALRPLTGEEAPETHPAVSPDGQQIAYARDGDIWLMNIDGGDQRPLTQTGVHESQPAWSPDGKRIAFVVTNDYRIHVMSVDGGDRMPLVKSYGLVGWQDRAASEAGTAGRLALADTPNGGVLEEPAKPRVYQESHPAWSPDGKTIAFQSSFDGDLEIYVQRIGSRGPGLRGPRQLTHNEESDQGPTFSPDGGYVAYSHGRWTSTHVWMTPADGSGSPVQLTRETDTNTVQHDAPVFSADGKKLFYTRWHFDENGTRDSGDLYQFDLASRTAAPLLVRPGEQRNATWQPLGFEPPASPIPSDGDESNGLTGQDGSEDGAGDSASDPSTPPTGCTMIGTSGDDVLVGTPGRDVICGLGGDDVIRGLGGNDLIKAGAGDDIVKGGQGNDRILGQAGDDELYGQGGRDTIKAGQGDDELTGNNGPDRLYGQAGDDTFHAKRGGRDLLKGGKGDDDAKADQHDRLRSIEHRL